MAKEIERISLLDISPPSITGDQNVKHLITSIDPELLSVSQDIREAFIVSRINELPEEVLDLLAWQWHVDFYELAHSLEAKREMVLKSIAWHRKKGTTSAILDALGMLGVEARFTSWQDEGAQPYTFAIDAKLTGDFWERVDWTNPTQTIRRAIQESKAVRSWMSKLYVYMEAATQHEISVGAATAQGTRHDIAFVPKTQGTGNMPLTVGTGTLQSQRHSIAIVQHTQGTAELDVAVGTGTAQGTRHDVAFIPKTKGTGSMSLTFGAGTSQAQHHNIAIVQRTHGSSGLNIKAGAATAQGIHHDIPSKQEASGTAGLGVSVATCTFQRQTHSVNIRQSTSSRATHGLSIGGAVACGIFISVRR